MVRGKCKCGRDWFTRRLIGWRDPDHTRRWRMCVGCLLRTRNCTCAPVVVPQNAAGREHPGPPSTVTHKLTLAG